MKISEIIEAAYNEVLSENESVEMLGAEKREIKEDRFNGDCTGADYAKSK